MAIKLTFKKVNFVIIIVLIEDCKGMTCVNILNMYLCQLHKEHFAGNHEFRDGKNICSKERTELIRPHFNFLTSSKFTVTNWLQVLVDLSTEVDLLILNLFNQTLVFPPLYPIKKKNSFKPYDFFFFFFHIQDFLLINSSFYIVP